MLPPISFSFLIFIKISIVFTKSEVLVHDENDGLWMTEQYLKDLTRLSFGEAICCNIYLYNLFDRIEDIFNLFINSYQYSYTVNRTSYDCKANLVLAENEAEVMDAVKQIPPQIAAWKMLIIYDSKVNVASEMFDGSLYKNAKVHLISPSGAWKLSANYLENREFIKVSKYEDLFAKKATDFEGRELHVSTYYKPPHSYLNKTIDKTINGVKAQVFLADNDYEMDGMEIRIMMILAEKLNFKYVIRRPIGTFRYGRKINSTTWRGGMMEQLINKEVDMAFGGIWLTEDVYSMVNLTEPWHELSINFLVPRPKAYTSFWALTRPFSPETWMAVVTMLLFYSTYLYARAWINPKTPKRYRNFTITLTELFGRLTGTWCPRNTSTLSIQLYLWQSAGLLVVAAYGSSLAARLTNSEYEDRINTVKQFIEANLTWGRQGPVPDFHNFFDLQDPYMRYLPERFHHEKSDEDRRSKIQKGNYAVIGRSIGPYFFPEDNITDEDSRGYRVMGNSVGKFYVSFAVQPWLFKPVNEIIYQLREAGILSYILKDVLRRRAGLYLREVYKEYDTFSNCPRVLSLTPLGAGFAVLIIGLIISSIVLRVEMKSVRDVKNTRKLQ